MKKSNLRNHLDSIREFFWPLLESKSTEQKNLDKKKKREYGDLDWVIKKISNIDNENYLKDFSSRCKEFYENEEKRLQTVESKAALFLGAEGLIIALIINFGGAIKSNIKMGFFWYMLMTILFITIAYFFMSAWYTLKALGRKSYYQIGESDLINYLDNDYKNYLSRLSGIYISNRVKNYETINSKVDSMVMAQEYFKRGLVTVFILSIIFILALVAVPKSSASGETTILKMNKCHLNQIGKSKVF